MSTPCDVNPALILGAIRDSLLAEVMARPAPEPVVLRRDIALLIASSLAEQIDAVDALAEGSTAADRLTEEMAVLRADRDRWKSSAEAYHEAWRTEVASSHARRRPTGGRFGEVVDLVEILQRERRTAGRPTDGGAA